MSVFDFHARLVPGGDGRLLQAMDRAGIDRAAVSAGGLIGLDELSVQITYGGRVETPADNSAVAQACERSGGRLLPFYFADPRRDVDAYRKEAEHFRGLEISPAVHGFRLDEPAVAELVAIAAAMRHPVYVVTTGRPGCRPADLARLAFEFPQAVLVWGHCGHTGLEMAGLAELAPLSNVVAELSGCLTVTARTAIDRLGAGRVLFGTEFPLQHPAVELAKCAALGLEPADRDRVLRTNACRLLGEDTTW
ncbi:amidohydrolase family protein [Actinoplanes sp. NPDC051411]|uniref:amidohydrolase family protein n=1 Tax=Actinoplanes sp. NPDC051411 TaxID=3155522 RepID=UPI00341D1436